MTSLYQNIQNEYEKLAENTKGFIFFYDEDDILKYIRYCGDLAQGVSLLTQRSKIPCGNQMGLKVKEYATTEYEKIHQTGRWKYYHQRDYDWKTGTSSWYRPVYHRVCRVQAFDCKTLVQEYGYRLIKEQCYLHKLPPKQAMAIFKQKISESINPHTKIERLETENLSLRQEIERLEKLLLLNTNCDNLDGQGSCENLFDSCIVSNDCIF